VTLDKDTSQRDPENLAIWSGTCSCSIEEAVALEMHSVSGCLSDQEALSNEQIQQLLSEAEARLGSLQGKGSTLPFTPQEAMAHRYFGAKQENRWVDSSSSMLCTLSKSSNHFASSTSPQLHAGALSEPYIVSKGDIARIDSARLVDRQDRVHSTRPKRVEDSVVTKENLSKVRTPCNLIRFDVWCLWGKQPKSHPWCRIAGLVLSTSLFPMRVHLEHSYSEAICFLQ